MNGTQTMIVWLSAIGAVTLMVMCYQILVYWGLGDDEGDDG